MNYKTHWMLVITFVVSSFITQASNSYVFTPNLTTDYKYMEVDKQGITVVVENRIYDGATHINLVLYHLNLNDMSLVWKTEDSIWATAIDAHISATSIYILHNVIGSPFHTMLSKFNRQNGELIWRRGIGGDLDYGQFLRVNEQSNAVVVAGENQEVSQLWRFDVNGILQSHLSLDIAIENSEPDSNDEKIYQLHLNDDNSIIIAAVMELTNTIRVIHLSESNSALFDHSFDQINLAFFNVLNLSVSDDNLYLITLTEESLFGIDRFTQYVLDEDGNLLFLNKTGELLHWPVLQILNQFLLKGKILNVADTSNQGPVDIDVFHTQSDGQFVPFYAYSYQGSGSFAGVRKALMTENENLFVIAGKRNIFPDTSIDDIYLRWDANGNLCSQFIDKGYDFYSFIATYQNDVFELRYRGEHTVNGRHLQVIKHLVESTCNYDLVFQSSFE